MHLRRFLKILFVLYILANIAKFVMMIALKNYIYKIFWKLVIHLITTFPISILLIYYGSHISRVIQSTKLKCLCYSILIIIIIRTLMDSISFSQEAFSQISIHNYLGNLCNSQPKITKCGDCHWIMIWEIFYYIVCEFLTMILILILIIPKE